MWEQVKDALGQSASRVLTGLASVLPGVVAMLVSVLLAAVVGRLVSAVLSRTLRRFSFDDRVDSLGFTMLADFSPKRSPSLLVGRVAFWFVVVLGVLVGLAAIDPVDTPVLFAAVLAFLPNVVVATLLLIVGAVVARFLGRSVLIGAVNLQIQSARLLSVGVKWMVMVLAAAMALNHLSIGGAVLTLAFGILFGGIVLALSLAVGLGSKDMVRRSWERQEELQAERRRGDRRSASDEELTDAPLQHL
jgi:hypothetical protein